MWVCRAGQNAKYLSLFLETSKIYLAWPGFNYDLNSLPTMMSFRDVVSEEMHCENRTSISNWAGQLKSFRDDLAIGDYVVIPHERSLSYSLAKITGEYVYEKNPLSGFYHSRDVEIVYRGIPRAAFTQTMQYSMGAFRTVFRVKKEDEVLNAFASWNG